MPSRRKKHNKRRHARRITSSGMAREANVLSGMLLPKRCTFHFATSVSLQLNATTSLVSELFRANGPWDPLYASGGLSCFNWDMWSHLYNHYVTLNSQIMVTIGACTAKSAAFAGIYLADDNSIPFKRAEDIIMARRGTYKVIPPGITAVPLKVYGRYNPKRFFNVAKPQDVESLRAKTNNLPTDQAIFWVWASSAKSEENTRLDMMVEIRYDVLFQEPRDISGYAVVSPEQVEYYKKLEGMVADVIVEEEEPLTDVSDA